MCRDMDPQSFEPDTDPRPHILDPDPNPRLLNQSSCKSLTKLRLLLKKTHCQEAQKMDRVLTFRSLLQGRHTDPDPAGMIADPCLYTYPDPNLDRI